MEQPITNFSDACQYYTIWIIKYYSGKFTAPIYFIWYTDDEGKDQLLVDAEGKIFAVQELAAIKTAILNTENTIERFPKLQQWLACFDQFEPVEYTVYNAAQLYNSVSVGNLDIDTLNELADYINLFSDYVKQDERNAHLLPYLDDEYLLLAWNYFYNYIFWPRFNDKEKFEAWDRPPLEIDNNLLAEGLQDLISAFDDSIKVFPSYPYQ